MKRAVFLLVLAMSPRAGASPPPTLEVVAPKAELRSGARYDRAFVVRLKSGGEALAGKQVLLRVAPEAAPLKLLDAAGNASGSLEAATDADGIVVVGALVNDLLPAGSSTAALEAVVEVDGAARIGRASVGLVPFVVSATFSKAAFRPGESVDEGLTVEVREAGKAKPGVTVTVESGLAAVRFQRPGGAPAPSAGAPTGADGKARFGVDTSAAPADGVETTFGALVHVDADGGRVTRAASAQLGSGYASSFLSDRVSSEVFLGTSLARSYDESGKSKGFDETSFVGRLRVDTLWTQKSRTAFHTGVELQFGSFPTTEATVDPNVSITSYADSFAGSLVFVLQPGWSWAAHYSKTSRNRRPELRFDALRLGAVLRLGLMSRDSKRSPDGDTDLRFLRAGVLVTHHQTGAATPEADDVNVFPMRYVEVSYGRFEQIFDQRDADRLVVEAGLRLPGIGNDAIPFYAGLYLNAGEGQDDLRVFAGLLFHVNKLVELFQR